MSSDPLRKDRHSYDQTFSVMVWNFEARGSIPFFPRDPAILITKTLLISNFHRMLSGLVLETHFLVLETHFDSTQLHNAGLSSTL